LFKLEEYASGSDAPPQKRDFGFDSLLPGLLDECASASDAPPQKQDFGFDSLLSGLLEEHETRFNGPPQKEDFGFDSLPPCLLKRYASRSNSTPWQNKYGFDRVPSHPEKCTKHPDEEYSDVDMASPPKDDLDIDMSHMTTPPEDDFKVNIPEVLKNFDPNADIFPLHEEYLKILMSSSPREGHGSSPETSCLDENTNNRKSRIHWLSSTLSLTWHMQNGIWDNLHHCPLGVLGAPWKWKVSNLAAPPCDLLLMRRCRVAMGTAPAIL
jgi:hypothetical protein